jgi:hypothetical protein
MKRLGTKGLYVYFCTAFQVLAVAYAQQIMNLFAHIFLLAPMSFIEPTPHRLYNFETNFSHISF